LLESIRRQILPDGVRLHKAVEHGVVKVPEDAELVRLLPFWALHELVQLGL